MDFSTRDDRARLGVITHGSLEEGIRMKLDAPESVEAVTAGSFVVVEGERFDFFSMVKDVRIEAANEQILLHPPSAEDDLLRKVMRGMGTYATLDLQPMLMAPQEDLEHEEPQSVKTIPSHFSTVSLATESDVARVFGAEENEGGDRYFEIGQPREMEDIPVCLDLKKFVERSNAVFGKTGTGKSFLTRLLLCGLIRTGRAVNLVFDMHSEYGMSANREAEGEAGGGQVPGLKKLFRSKVALFSLDPASARRDRNKQLDHAVYLYADQVRPADVLPLRDTLNLNETATESAYLLNRTFKDQWLMRLLDAESDEVQQLAEQCGAHYQAVDALRRRLVQFEQYDFFRTESSEGKDDVLAALLDYIDDGRSVVLEFGRYNDLKAYLLVANAITRRLRERYVERTNQYQSGQADPPQQLMITIEEAHKFLTPQIAHETSFGKIAREMRKYFVSLLVVDQRPSAIDDEVLSQIGTKIVAQLSDDRDLRAALVGTRESAALRKILASLDSKQQALLMGHAVPMPMAIKTRTYNQNFFSALHGGSDGAPKDLDEMTAEMKELF